MVPIYKKYFNKSFYNYINLFCNKILYIFLYYKRIWYWYYHNRSLISISYIIFKHKITKSTFTGFTQVHVSNSIILVYHCKEGILCIIYSVSGIYKLYLLISRTIWRNSNAKVLLFCNFIPQNYFYKIYTIRVMYMNNNINM